MQPYPQLWTQMRPGDVIAFGSGGFRINPIGRSVEIGSCSNVAHVAVVERVLGDGDVTLIESTAIGRPGVKRSFLSERLLQHRGDVWWLPLCDAVRGSFQIERFRTFLDDQHGKSYDLAQAIAAGIDWLDRAQRFAWITRTTENLDRLFCSELIAAAFVYSGVIPPINASEVTPIDLCRFAIYAQQCFPLKANDETPCGYNTIALTTE